MILGRLSVRDFINYRVLDRMIIYEKRIESSMYRAMRELQNLQQRRMDKEAIAIRDHAGQKSTTNKRGDLKKRSQFAPELMGTISCITKGYGGISPVAKDENKDKRSRLTVARPGMSEGGKEVSGDRVRPNG
jgi:hypothetical protein